MDDAQNLRQNSLHNPLMNNGGWLKEVEIEAIETSALLISPL